MKRCPWCGRENLNVYAYCQGCGRGFSATVEGDRPPPGSGMARYFSSRNVRRWLAGGYAPV